MRHTVTVGEMAEALAIFSRYCSEDDVAFTDDGPALGSAEPDHMTRWERERLAELGWRWKAGLYWTLAAMNHAAIRDAEDDSPVVPEPSAN